MFRNAILPEADLYLYPPPPPPKSGTISQLGNTMDGAVQSMAASPGSPRRCLQLGFGLNTTEQYRVHTCGVRLFTL